MKSKEQPINYLASVVIVILVYGILSLGLFTDLENTFYDYRAILRAMLSQEIEDRIVMVNIDEASLREAGHWPWPRRYHAYLLNQLHQDGAKVIAMDIVFDLPSNEEDDAIFAKSIEEAGNVVLGNTLDLQLEYLLSGRRLEIRGINNPLPQLVDAARGIGYYNIMQDRDGAIRRLNILETEEDLLPLSLRAIEVYYDEPLTFAKEEILIDFNRPLKSFLSIPYYKALQRDFPPGFFQDKIVFVGATDPVFRDYLTTPLDLWQGYWPGVYIHAQIVSNALDGRSIRSLPSFIVFFSFLLLSLLGAHVFSSCSPVSGLKFLALFVFSITLLLFLLFIFFQFYFPLLTPLLILFFNFISCALSWYLLVDRKRREVRDFFSHYVPPQVVDRIIEEENLSWKGEEMDVSIAFVDISSFTTFSEQNNPVEVVDYLNQYLKFIVEEVFRVEGTLDKFLGDGAMVIFGAPIKQKDHARRAVEFATTLQERIKENEEMALFMTVGIHSGPAIVGNVGSEARMEYTAIGDTVNTAARLQGVATKGEIIISEVTYQLVKDHFSFLPRGEVSLKGKDKPVKIYEVPYGGGDTIGEE